MARNRMIRPEFFVDDKIAELSPWARLLFIGLWTVADRDGRMKYNQRVIGAQVFPHDEIEVAPLFAELLDRQLIQTYEAEGVKVLCIPNFRKHQKVHPHEPSANLPEPPESMSRQSSDTVTAEQQQCHDSAVTMSELRREMSLLSKPSSTSTSTSTSSPKPESKTPPPPARADGPATDGVDTGQLCTDWVRANISRWPENGNEFAATHALQQEILQRARDRPGGFEPREYLERASARLEAWKAYYAEKIAGNSGRNRPFVPNFQKWIADGEISRNPPDPLKPAGKNSRINET